MVGEIEDFPDEKPYEEYERLQELYFSLASSNKEDYAHRFADELKVMLEKAGAIPFDRIER